MKEQANNVFEICSYVDGLEKRLLDPSLKEELTNMEPDQRKCRKILFCQQC